MDRKRAVSGSWVAALLASILLIAGCVTKVPLSDVDKSTVDSKLVGLWDGPKDGDDSVLLAIVPFDSHGYIVTYSKYQKTAAGITTKGQVVCRAWVTKIGGKDCYTFDIRTPRSLLSPDAAADGRNYIVGTWTLDDGTLTLTALNGDQQAVKDAATTEALQKLVADHLNDKDWFKDFQTYKKVPPDGTKDALAVLEQFEK